MEAPWHLYLMAALYVGAGINHFVQPRMYLRIIPAWLPNPTLMNALAGLAEVALGLALLYVPLRVPAAWGVVALLIAIFPANVYMLQLKRQGQFRKIPEWTLWVRLPIQAVLIAWALLYV